MIPSSSPSNSLLSTKEPGLKTPRRKEVVNESTKPYHSEPWPTRILPSVSQGHHERLSLPKQIEDTDLLSKSVWMVSQIYFTVESSCFIYLLLCPLITCRAKPQMIGLPTNTALAPRARALRMSVPFRTPPSRKTSTFPSTASTISGRTSICGDKRSVKWYYACWIVLQFNFLRPPTIWQGLEWKRLGLESTVKLFPLKIKEVQMLITKNQLNLELSDLFFYQNPRVLFYSWYSNSNIMIQKIYKHNLKERSDLKRHRAVFSLNT